MAKKLEVIELNLGVDPESLTKKPSLSPATQQRITEFTQQKQQEHDAIIRYQQKKQKEEKCKEEAAIKVYKALSETTGNGLTVDELLEISQTPDIISLMVRLRKLIKQRGNLWDIKKGKRNGKSIYRFMPTQLKEKPSA